MNDSAERAIAIVGVGAILPEAPSATAFWDNVINKRYCIRETPPDRWSIDRYYDPDMKAPDKTYSKIGGWVRGFQFDWKRFRIPPRVTEAMDLGQQWAVTIAADALADYGYPTRPLNTERTAVILGTAMGGELHFKTHLRVVFPEYAQALEQVDAFEQLPSNVKATILSRWHEVVASSLPQVTEDSMPGELPNIVSGRVANVLDLHGPNFITDAACAASFAAVNAAIELLTEHQVDAVLTGGVDRNMAVSTFVKFCKIGALSPTGSRPFGEGADGFVMGEGAAAFLLKRLEDAERAGDKIYAVIRGIGGSSDGRGKGITAPNPVGQFLAAQRAWENAGLDPATATLIEAHGTSTKVGDVTEAETLGRVFGAAPRGSIALGSVKGNIGHLKAGAGAAGLLKATYAVYNKILPPTLNSERPNPSIDFSNMPLALNHETREWPKPNGGPRRAGVSAYGFGGTNFHIVLEEHVPGALTSRPKSVSVPRDIGTVGTNVPPVPFNPPPPLRGILALGARTPKELHDKLDEAVKRSLSGWTPPIAIPKTTDVTAPERLVIDFADHDDLLHKMQTAQKAMSFDTPQAWKALTAQGIFRGSGPKPGKVAFMFPGQGSQYLNMGKALAAFSPIVAQVFKDADAVMTPILGQPLTDFIFVETETAEAQFALMQTAITQPAMLTADIAIMKLLAAYGFAPDIVMGHSLGEYAALIAAGIMPFAHALEAAAARGSEMTKVSMSDNGKMAAVIAPPDVVDATLKEIKGYVVPANINSNTQVVIGGASDAVETAVSIFTTKGYQAMVIPVSHAFHTEIVAPASVPLRAVLDRLDIREPKLPLVANVTGELYPTTVEAIKDILQLQIASPVQWVKGLHTLYENGVRAFVECGPKRALKSFADDVFNGRTEVVSLLTNHPKQGEIATFNQALCGLYAAGYAYVPAAAAPKTETVSVSAPAVSSMPTAQSSMPISMDAFSQMLTAALQQTVGQLTGQLSTGGPKPYNLNDTPSGSVVVTGTGLGLPGADKPVMDPENAMRILRGEQFVDLIPERFRKKILAKRITRLVKSEDGSGRFELITNPNEVIRLAGRGGPFDLSEEYGVPSKLIEALDITTQLAMAAGLDALREAGIPLVMTYKHASTGKYLPDRWMLPESLRDETGVVFGSAFPGGDRYADEFTRYFEFQNQLDQLALLEDLRQYTTDNGTLTEINRRITALRESLEAAPYEFDRRFIFRILAMGHSQFAEFIGARGPNTHVNAACASTTQAISVAEDWIRTGRCRRVVVLGADDVTSERLMEWVGSGFLASGAAATDDRVEEAALPFDRRRHGTILGMGATALVLESEDAVRERGMRGLVEVLSTEHRNSAYHGTRLDVDHVAMVMEALVTSAERRFGLHRKAIASQLVFMSHETYTPARGGSASAEVVALRHTFGDATKDIVIANTKGFTGHPMGVGIEDAIAVKILEHGIVPPVPNYKEVDPDLGVLNLSRGGRYPVLYALHLSAGFGSQIAMTLTRRIPGRLDRTDNPTRYQRWLDDISGYDHAELEVTKRTLHIKDQGLPTRTPVPSPWEHGIGPMVRAAAPAQTDVAGGTSLPTPAPRPRATVDPLSIAPKVAAQPAKLATKPESAPLPAAPVAKPEPAAPIVPAKPAIDEVTEKVLAIIANQTGYPVDMLDPELDLEADLGVDTVKQAETFTAIREAFGIPRRDDLKLRDYPTVAKVIGFVKTSRPELAVSAAAQVAPVPTAQPVPTATSTSVDTVAVKVLEIVSAQTGYPVDMLDPELDLEADLGVDTVKQAETFTAIREAFDIPRRDDLKLRDYPTIAKVIGFVKDARPDLSTSAPQPMPATTSTGVDTVAAKVLEIVSAQTGYPVDMLDPELDLEADLGVDTVKQAETFTAIREAFDIPRRDDLKLRDYPTIAKVIGFVKSARPDLSVESVPVVVPVSAPAPSTSTSDSIAAKVLEIVSAQTGYPVDMLDPELDLEADLGVDTVKQAETFTAIREAFDIPRRDDLKLRDYPTIAKVIGFVKSARPDLVVSAPAPTTATATTNTDPITAKVLEIVSEQTGYPQEMLDLDLDLEADLGVDTVKQAETFAAVRQAFDIPRRDDLKLRDYPTLAKVIGFVRDMRPDLAALVPNPAPDSTVAVLSGGVSVPALPPAGADAITAKVLEIVSAQTGYPQEMLDLDLDLEADLGVDTVKQAETFAAVRQAFDIPRRDELKLRDYPTLAKVIGFVRDMRPDLATVSATPAVVAGTIIANAAKAAKAIERTGAYPLEFADKMPRRVATPTLRPALDVCKRTGVILGEGSRVLVVHDQGGVGEALVALLRDNGIVCLEIEKALSAKTLESRIKGWLEEGPIQGVYWLPALDVEPNLETMDLDMWHELNRVRVKNLYATMRALYDVISTADTFLVSATRLGGLHGYGPHGASAPLGGAVTGFTKAYKRERGDVLVKAVDAELNAEPHVIAERLAGETAADPGVVEVGYYEGNRYSVTLLEKPAVNGEPGLTLDTNTVFIITGAAGGITSAITADLASASGGIFYLLDLVAVPEREDAKVKLFRNDKEALKRALIDEAKAAGEKPTPAQIDKAIAAIERKEAALRAVEAVENAGGTAYYYSVDLTDSPAVAKVVEDIRERHGRIDVIVHAGGLEISRSLADKDAKQFNLVFDVKADGFYSLLHAAKGMPIGATVVFSSVAGRFGNNGQTDYSAANDLLCKITSSLRTWRPETRGIAIDWTAWGGIGMATRGSIPKIMEMAGIEMLPPEAGIPTVRRELVAGSFRGEVLVGGKLGVLVKEYDEQGGVDTAKLTTLLAEQMPPLRMLGEVVSANLYGGLEIRTVLDPKEQPFLYDHAMEGTPLLPGVMGVESFAELASALAPGYAVREIRDVEYQAAFKFYRMEPQTLVFNAQSEPNGNSELVVSTTLRSVRELADGSTREKLHFAAKVVLSREATDLPTIEFTPPAAEDLPYKAERIYQLYFHGPAYQVLEAAQVDGNEALGLMAQNLPPNYSPAEAASVMAPRLIEFCFQTAGIWEMQTKGVMALPLGIQSVTTYRQHEDAGDQRLYALVEAVDNGASFNALVVDATGAVYVKLTMYRTVQLPGSVHL